MIQYNKAIYTKIRYRCTYTGFDFPVESSFNRSILLLIFNIYIKPRTYTYLRVIFGGYRI